MLTPSQLVIAFAGCVLGVQLLLHIYRYFASPLRSVPGPFIARFTDLWYLKQVQDGAFHKVNRELHKKYGPIVRYGPNRYSFDDPNATKVIYSHGSEFGKSEWYSSFSQPGEWNLFEDRNKKHHAFQRRQYQNAYSMSSLVEYEPYVDQCADLYSQRLSELSKTGLQANLGHWMQCYAFDVIGCITYSERFGFLDRGLDIAGIINAIEWFLWYSSLMGLYAYLHPYYSKLQSIMIQSGKEPTGIPYIQRFTQDLIAKKTQGKPQAVDSEKGVAPGVVAKDFLTKFLERHAQDPETFTNYHIFHGCNGNMMAGSDTTAISLSAILYYLLKYPHCYQRLREEVDEYQRQGKIGQFVNFRQSLEMSYLQAVIKEALRMHPSTGLPLERVVPTGGATIAGQFFPEGTIVGVNTWVEHRSQNVFGEDANEFRPERWLDEDSDKIAFMNRHWMPFGLGSRTCIGRHVSMLEISKLIPLLVRDFDFELAGDLAPKGAEWSCANRWFVKPKNFTAVVRARVRKEP